ncbi:1-acyl-sn-glycerol-3-phosphate acyltransferase [Pseudorhodoferax sp. Leaf274]|uniref:lysophospholipid acyltransferase family protein n=1 Tax=Pseudorhodoferax sp. Leaf274 TaxID=1736318 RepID=UPI0007031A1E|nr:lysophospholipid acyltransferase family protein [Pseudorhodoferax sp. Leaf274]KQP43981.1 glycerol acyltransferase [Pseudorhodoferax sp. Leaf274]
MRHARALWRLLRLIGHGTAGLWTIRTRFAGWEPRQREQAVQAWAARVLALSGIRLDVGGQAMAAGPVLLVANHISWLDIVVMHAAGYCRFVSKADVAHWPLIGSLATGAGTLYIERASRRDAMRVVHHMRDRLVAGDVVAIFPEGTTGDGRTLLPFHANLVQAAISADVPIQPLALRFADSDGATSFAPSFVGDETLVGSVWRTLAADGLVAQVRYGAPQEHGGRDRRAWAQALHDSVARLRQELGHR